LKNKISVATETYCHHPAVMSTQIFDSLRHVNPEGELVTSVVGNVGPVSREVPKHSNNSSNLIFPFYLILVIMLTKAWIRNVQSLLVIHENISQFSNHFSRLFILVTFTKQKDSNNSEENLRTFSKHHLYIPIKK